MIEIVDLTVSESPHPEIIEILSDQGNTPSPGPCKRTQEDTRRKGKKGATPTSNDLASHGDNGICSAAQSSRTHSPQIRNNRSEQVNESTPRHFVPQPIVDEPGLFFFDGAAVPIAADDVPPLEPVESNGDGNSLLLPPHVAICHDGEDRCTFAQILPPPKLSSDDEEYIEYLDYEDRKAPGLVRYFEVEGEEINHSRPSIFKCKNCGAEGDHRTYECPIQICLTCGARDEHSTRSCPIGKTCYTCGMKGHINKTCPNRFSARTISSEFRDDCEHCGSPQHNTNECPTLWRIYRYVNDAERIMIVQSREKKRQLAIGDGGEGYIGDEVWCYNCANTGHLGDDCDELPHAVTFPTENSAFGAHNVMSGPFCDPTTEPVPVKRGSRERGSKIDWPRLAVDWDAGAPVDVGKRGKNKDRAKLEKRFREQEDEGEDWFDDIRNVRGEQVARPARPRGNMLKLRLFKDGAYEPSSQTVSGGTSLLARLSGPYEGASQAQSCRFGRTRKLPHQSENFIRIRGAATGQRNQDGKDAPGSRKTERTRGEGRQDRDKPGHQGSKQGHGPRYKGGYC